MTKGNITLPIIGTPSRTETGARCYRRAAIADVLCLGRKDRKEANTAAGTVLHAGAAAHWRGELVPEAARKAYMEYAGVLDASDYPLPMLQAMLTNYQEQAVFAADAVLAEIPGWRAVAIEERVIMDLDPRARLSFQLDRLGTHDESGMWVLADTKSHKKHTPYKRAEWEKRWGFSLQQMIYRWVVVTKYGMPLEKLEHFIEGVEKSVPSKVTYVRLPEWSWSQLVEAKERLIALCQKHAGHVAACTRTDGSVDFDALLERLLSVADYNPDDCMAYFTPCPLYDVCRAPVEHRVGLVRSDFEYVEPLFLE